ncbi:YbaK family protein [Pseudalkalibacillus decolorationis]|uniref:YbaK family protein n=1 Tax=Pseudalkalibacillus decolorationis TaxID=163879 RepID=UPI0021491850|nr:YbaK family protein [Pseudalkalibacillus decolorationis]
MNVITTFREKQYKKRITFERKVLRELSLNGLKTEFTNLFTPFFQYSLLFQDEIQDTSIDIAIEAFLLGAEFSRFGYHGESIESIKQRSEQAEKRLIDTLYEYWQFWSYAPDEVHLSLQTCCDAFVQRWWREGFEKGQRRYKMRLH